MSLWKKMTGKSWAKHRGIATMVGGAVLGAVTGGLGYLGMAAGLTSAVAGGAAGAAIGGAYQQGDAQRQQEKAAKAAVDEAEALANTGQVADTPEAAATVDTAGNAAWKRKQQAMAANVASGRSGTRMTSNLGGSSRLG